MRSDKPVMLLVLGPHRSGTSLAARMLECLGAKNSLNQIPPQPDNPTGFFEDADIFNFNEHVLLPRLGHRWSDASPVDWSRISKADRSRLELQAIDILRSNYPATTALSVLKEPRINNTLPFWPSVLERAGFDARAVCVVRDPLSVARSLEKRDGFPIVRGCLVFNAAWTSVLPQLDRLKTGFVQFDEIFTEPRKCLEDLAKTLALTLPEDFEGCVRTFAAGHLRGELRHSRVCGEDLSLEQEVPLTSIAIYRALVDAAENQSARKAAALIESWKESLEAVAPILRGYDHLHKELRVAENNLSSTSLECRALQAERVDLATERDEARRQLQQLADRLHETSGHLSARTAERDEARRQLQQLADRLRETSDHLSARTAERDEARRQLQQVADGLRETSDHLSARTAERDEARRQLQQVADRLRETSDHLSTRTAERDEARRALGERIMHLEQQAKHWRRLRQDVETSTSWRVTKPLRAISRLARSFAGEQASKPGQEIQSWTGEEDYALVVNSGLFDHDWYGKENPDAAKIGCDAALHFMAVGARLGRDPHPLFSVRHYVRASGIDTNTTNPLLHYLKEGWLKGLSPHPSFEPEWYTDRYPDVREAGVNPLVHFVLHGIEEGRFPNRKFADEFGTVPSFSKDALLSRIPRNSDGMASQTAKLAPKDSRPTKGIPPLNETNQAPAPPPEASAPHWLEHRWPALSPLRIFPVSTQKLRISIVTDSIGSSSLFGGVGTALLLGSLVANRLGASLRIITRTEEADPSAVGLVLSANGVELRGPLETAFSPPGSNRGLPVSRSDFFITTSWWTTRPVLASIAAPKIAYLLQEDERMFYPFGDERLLCEDTLKEESVYAVINSSLLFEHLTEGPHALPGLRTRSAFFEPAFARSQKPRDGKKGKKRLFFYARPDHPRNLFCLGLASLERAMSKGVFPAEEWDIFFVGRNIPELRLSGNANVQRVESLPWPEYKSLVASMDAGFSLMYTPHPSYPPLDLAAAGAAVLTNKFGGKTDLARYSKNIITASLELDDLTEGLASLAELGRNKAERLRNLETDGLCRDWNQALAQAAESLAGRFSGAVDAGGGRKAQ